MQSLMANAVHFVTTRKYKYRKTVINRECDVPKFKIACVENSCTSFVVDDV